MSPDQALLEASKAWPVTEALRLRERVRRAPPAKGFVLFETGYGPSGLPHIGTFAEVFRTTLIRQTFRRLSDLPTELYAFSDDMDGLRKVPDNIPNRELVERHLGRPLTAIPDPFGTHDSYGHHMNARLQAFLDAFGFAYTFQSATDCYRSGRFNETLLLMLERHDAVREVVLPTLGPERRQTYSPILPISPRTGRVLQVPILECRVASGTVVFRDEDGTLAEVPVTDGHCKLQWKADWALRWAALDVDYEMSGKDLIPSVELSSRICRVLGARPPENLTYELFLDEQGQKISKSKGNGLTIEEWLRYGTRESLMLFLYRDPKKAKRLSFDVIPRSVDDYQSFLEAFSSQEPKERLGNPVWHIHDGAPPVDRLPISFTMLLNLAAVANAEEPDVLWGFISRDAPGTTPATSPKLARLVGHALAYYRDFVRPAKVHRAPDPAERAALEELAAWLAGVDPEITGEAIQHEIYEVGKRHGFANLRDWFKALYEILLGQSEGPRLGSFFRLYGLDNSRRLVARALAGELARP
ncbi:MAG TPA: lysine--tRNA ligase [Geminicoccaceae bacterium]|nr:lysine--tRNA ligase [Geminicoccaceae bacterium]